jgi:hypothetical protein
MRNKKATNGSPEDEVLEKRVDAMMDPALPNSTPAPDAAPTSKPLTPPPLDIFSGLPDQPSVKAADEPKTAPAVPAKLLKPLEAETPESPAGSPAPKKPEAAIVPDQPEAVPPAAGEPAAAPAPEQTAAKPGVGLPQSSEQPVINLDDEKTDAAVDDIVAHESDQVLAAEDALAAGASRQKTAKQPGKLRRFFGSKWIWIAAGILILAIAAWPYSRYKVLGLALKKTVTVAVVDSKTNTPVSRATVQLDGVSAKTDANGTAKLYVPVGAGNMQVSEQYYRNTVQRVFIGLAAVPAARLTLVATGRQVPVKVVNRIGGQPLAGAVVSVLSTSAKTNAQGVATIVLPVNSNTDQATISLAGYNVSQAPVTVTGSVVAANTFQLVPAGQVYFLSNASGKIDVVKTNLDGSSRQTVLPGTGQEDPVTTVLLASRDWHYLVLEAQRSGSQAALYLIDTSNEKVTGFDNTNAAFTPIGWLGDDFTYDVAKNTVPTTAAGHEVLKSYNAATGQLYQLDQNQVVGSGSNFAYQNFSNFDLVNDALVYTTQWAASGTADLSGQSATIRTIQANGQDKKDLFSTAAPTVGYFQSVRYQPGIIYYALDSYADNKTTYYTYQNNTVSPAAGLTATNFDQPYPLYYPAPAGDQTFWSQLRDGQNSLFIGDSTGQNQKAVASSGSYKAFGWYTNSYLLVTDKNNSQLLILPANGAQTPLKVADYYSQPQGGSYGYGNF